MSEGNHFPTTHWTRVQRIASEDTKEAAKALEETCLIYWQPLFKYALSLQLSVEDAEDCVQGFLGRISSQDFFQTLSPSKGKLRSFLLVSFKHYIYDFWRQEQSQKRGGHLEVVPFLEKEIHALCEVKFTLFDQEWAIIVIENAKKQLQERYRKRKQETLFLALLPCLDGSKLKDPASVQRQFQLSAVAYKSAIHRIRRRFGEEIKKIVAETVLSSDEVENEIRWLLKALEA